MDEAEELARVKRVEASNLDGQLQRAEMPPTADQALWVVKALSGNPQLQIGVFTDTALVIY
jgi:hypothetical protein